MPLRKFELAWALDTIGPILSGVGAFVGTYFYSYYIYPSSTGTFRALLDHNILVIFFFTLIFPLLLTYFFSTRTCGRERHILFSWGSVGGTVGFLLGYLTPLSWPFQLLFWSTTKGMAASSVIFTIIFSYMFHSHFKKRVKGGRSC